MCVAACCCIAVVGQCVSLHCVVLVFLIKLSMTGVLGVCLLDFVCYCSFLCAIFLALCLFACFQVFCLVGSVPTVRRLLARPGCGTRGIDTRVCQLCKMICIAVHVSQTDR